MNDAPIDDLRKLAARHGVEPNYVDGRGTSHRASTEALEAVLGAMGVRDDDPDSAIEADRPPPVIIAWDGSARIELPDGAKVSIGYDIDIVTGSPAGGTSELGRHTGGFSLAELPTGYHELTVDTHGRSTRSTIVSAPTRVWTGSSANKRPIRGLMAPLYAIRDDRTPALARYASLGRLAAHVAAAGGDAISTLPILPTFLDGPNFDPSPYSPVSRLFWNELFVDTPVLHNRPTRRRPDDLVDYRDAWAEQASALVTMMSAAPSDFERRLADRPDIAAYSDFRGDRLYAYGQLLAEQQLAELRGELDRLGVLLYLDLPVGVNPNGFDAHCRPDLHLTGIHVGAPPDPVFADGQDWQFPPMSPTRSRAEGHRFFARCLRHQMRIADYLRIDHFMSMHRLFWIPASMPSSAGMYVDYPSDELYAVLCAESHINRCRVVGEDLGTVPDHVRSKMRRHGVSCMHLVEYELDAVDKPLAGPQSGDFGGLNTHDMAPFAAFWRDAGAARRARLMSYLDSVGHAPAGDDAGDVLDCLLDAASDWDTIATVVSLEDLWLETEPQNVPGSTGEQRPNWRRRFPRTLDEIAGDPIVSERLARLFAPSKPARNSS